MGKANVILKIKIINTFDRLVLMQSHYIKNILKKFNAYGILPMRTSIDLSIHLRKNQYDPVFQLEYAWINGKLCL